MKILDRLLRLKIFQTNLRTKLTLAFVLPMVTAVGLLSYIHTSREWTEMQELVQESAVDAGYLTLGSMRHALMANDKEAIVTILGDLEQQSNIRQVWLVNNYGLVTNSANEARKVFRSQTGCVECHLYAPEDRPQSIYLPDEETLTLRVTIPIKNDVECQACHAETDAHLGVLLIDYKMMNIRAHLREDLWISIWVSIIMVTVVLIFSYALIQWLVERRIRTINDTLSVFATGDFSVRIPVTWRTNDEITDLADGFNEMADSLERHEKEQREAAAVRHRAILDERERLSRELHDGIAQVLGYLSTKLSAIRLFIEQGQVEHAERQLVDMEKIVNRENKDVRVAIAGLQAINLGEETFFEQIQTLVERCQEFCDMEISQKLDAAVEDIRLAPDVELHLGRIIQEAINNARKHAQASKIEVSVNIENDELIIVVADNGIGFNPWQRSHWQLPHMGLNSMSNRAEKAGAEFSVHSKPGQGTQIIVKVKLNE